MREYDSSDFVDVRVERDMRRQEAIEEAVRVADNVILDASDGSCEETNYLTAMLALRLAMEASRPLREAEERKRGIQAKEEYGTRIRIIQDAAQTALGVIAARTDGSVEEKNWLTSSVALKFAQKAHQPFQSALLKKDLGF